MTSILWVAVGFGLYHVIHKAEVRAKIKDIAVQIKNGVVSGVSEVRAKKEE